MQAAEARRLALPDGRRLAYAEYGDPSGPPVLSCHGGLSSRLDGVLLDAGARAAGVRVIVPDRPGIGLSDPRPGLTVMTWSADAAALLDALAIDRCAVVGWSLGGQYTLGACAALGPRVTRAALLASVAPFSAVGSTEGLSRSDRTLLRLSTRAPRLARAGLAGSVRRAPLRAVQRSVQRGLGAPDIAALQTLADPLAAARFVRESVRQGTAGVVGEYQLWRAPWGFALEDIATQIDVWQGDSDTFVPTAYADALTRAIPTARRMVLPGEGHVSLVVRHAHSVLAALR